jgi:3-hydroxymyristoyl/3-hydroxydecanoyl-(acyl carrier protein) dehydratase
MIAFDYQDITRILPHRPPFLLVDRIIGFEPDRRIVGIKNVAANEPYMATDRGRRLLPPSMLMEAIAQVGAILVLAKDENRHSLIYFSGVTRARYRRPAFAGDQVVIEAWVDRLRGRMGRLKGRARVNGALIAHGMMSFALGSRDDIQR